MAARTVFVGLDAMDRRLADELIAAGGLPVLASLLQRGTVADVTTPDVHLVGGTWVSFWTGLEPIDHLFWADWQLVPGTYTERRWTPHDVTAAPFWEAIDRAGGKVAAVDVPLTEARPLADGLSISEWGSHDRFVGYQTWPATLADEVVADHGRHAETIACNTFAGDGRWADLQDRLVEGARAKADLLVDVLGREDWDLFLTVFGESHCAGHQFWKFHDPSHPDHAAALELGLGDPVATVYGAIDEQLGRFLEACGPDANVYVLLSHGMGGHYDATSYLPDILAGIADHDRPRPVVRAREAAFASAGRVIRKGVRAAYKALGVPRPPRRRAVDGSRPFFAVYNNDAHAAIRLNVVGREPRGQVHPDEVADVVARLTADLLDLRDADAGTPIVRRVVPVEDVYGGRTHPAVPDLFVDWVRGAPIGGVSSPKVGTLRGGYRGVRSGDHRPGGRVVAVGPDVPRDPAHLPQRLEAFADHLVERVIAQRAAGTADVAVR